MKKLFSSIPQLLVSTAFIIAAGCNGAKTHNDTDTTNPANESSHPDSDNTIINDTTRTATSGMGNDVAAMSDTGFISKSFLDNMMEIQLAKLAKSKGKDQEVIQLAVQMIKDHTQMQDDVKALAVKKHVPLRADADVADEHIKALGNATGTEFDQAWVKQMLTLHDAKIAELQSVISNTHDADIKALATKLLPKIKIHRDMLAAHVGQ